ncbi:MAG: hypothetical protein WCC36_13115, partial [Gammaproteobacteria bacterium]
VHGGPKYSDPQLLTKEMVEELHLLSPFDPEHLPEEILLTEASHRRLPNLRDLLEREAGNVRAAEAVALFCYQVKKWNGAFAAALGGLDTLVFAGGIGENAPTVRTRICDGLKFLGIELEEERNAKNAGVISATSCRVAVRVICTDEERMIAKMVCRVLDLA